LETGLDFAEARYYNNIHGRFTAVDPLLASGKSGNPQSFNRYAYTMNQPLTMTDKKGLQTEPAQDFWTFRDTANGRSFYKAKSEEDRKFKETVWGGSFNKWQGNDFYIFDPDTAGSAIFLGANGSGKGYMFPTSSIPREQLDSLISTQQSGGSFSSEQNRTLMNGFMEQFSHNDLEVDLKVKLPASIVGGGLAGAAEKGLGSIGGRGLNAISNFRAGGSTFGERLFNSKTFGKTSTLFANEQYVASNTPGLLNKGGSIAKVGWSGGKQEMGLFRPRYLSETGLGIGRKPSFFGGGAQFRIGLGRGSGRSSLYHFDIPRTFVPNSIANPFKIK
jgi:RHS repeat-associated protein